MENTPLRVWIYRLLAAFYDGDFEDTAGPPPAPDNSKPAGLSGALERFLAATRSLDPADLRAEHTRLFVNARDTPVAPPYASLYLDGHLLGPSSAWVRSSYAAQGLDADPAAGEPADYLSAELEFAYFLSRHEIAARHTADEHTLAVVLDAERRFIQGHLARWVPAFVARTAQARPNAAFAAAGALLTAVVQEDDHRLTAQDAPRNAVSQRAATE